MPLRQRQMPEHHARGDIALTAGSTLNCAFSTSSFLLNPSSCIRVITTTAIVLWTLSALLAAGIGWSRYDKKKTRDKHLAELAAMAPEHREKLLSRLNPALQTEMRQQLMRRYGLS